MFLDRVTIWVRSGDGGDGAATFRREAHVPRGGPDGGDGGRGGSILLRVDPGLTTLRDFRFTHHFRAEAGGRGLGAKRHGRSAEDLVIAVPPGTGVLDEATGELLADLVATGQEVTIAPGGRGGLGNVHFATSTHRAPQHAQKGEPGVERGLRLELRLIAEVGLVGLPNAGKSSLLSRLTRAAPKVASYPFTTLSPVLGVLEGDDRQLIVADIPGLIEGASEGAGLGHDFLAHVERTRLLVHVLDLAPEISQGEGADALANYTTIEHELAAHDERLARLPRILALSKADLVTPERAAEALAEWQERLGSDVPVFVTSSATGEGLPLLAGELLRRVSLGGEEEGEAVPAQVASVTGEDELAEHMVFRPTGASGFRVERVGPGAFAVRGRGIERLLARYEVENEDAMAYLEGRLRRIGVLRALEAEGFQPGDEIEIAGVTFELDPSA